MTHTVNREPCPTLLRILIDYDPLTGAMVWRKRSIDLFRSQSLAKSWNSRYSGRSALMSMDRDGYLTGRIFLKLHRAHRVAWAIYSGEWPDVEMDHINGDRANNKISNLRLVTREENMMNRKVCSRNKSGAMGVSWCKYTSKWRSTIRVNGVQKTIGRFDKIDDAKEARITASNIHGYHQNHGRLK